jgi:D-aminopeptidase
VAADSLSDQPITRARARTRDLGVAIGVLPTGPLNAITDVPGVLVGHCTVCWGGPDLPPGSGPARTGVTAILPHPGDLFREKVVAGVFAANGVGEVVGSTAIREWGVIETPVMLASSQAIGRVYDATVRWVMAQDEGAGIDDVVMPVVGECDDGSLNDARGMHVLEEHVHAALDSASSGPVAEGCVGAGTGMTAFDFKAGIGTSSRVVSIYGRPYTLGALVMSNFGSRHRLSIDGVPVGCEISDLMPVENRPGSCIVVLATDAPLSARHCERLALRGALGLAQVGSTADDGSGEIMVAFSTAAKLPRKTEQPVLLEAIGNDRVDPLFEAAVDATTEAVVNSLFMATTTTGVRGNVFHALPLHRLPAIMGRYGRPVTLPAGAG